MSSLSSKESEKIIKRLRRNFYGGFFSYNIKADIQRKLKNQETGPIIVPAPMFVRHYGLQDELIDLVVTELNIPRDNVQFIGQERRTADVTYRTSCSKLVIER